MERDTVLAAITIAALAVVLWNWSNLMALFHSTPAPLTDSVLVTDVETLRWVQGLRAGMQDRLEAKYPDDVNQRDPRVFGLQSPEEDEGALKVFAYPGRRLPKPYNGSEATYSPPELSNSVFPRCYVVLKRRLKKKELAQHELVHDIHGIPGHPQHIFGPVGTLTFRI